MPRSSYRLASIASAFLLFGLLYYLSFRWQGSELATRFDGLAQWRATLFSDPTYGVLPSFIHTFSLGLLAIAFMGAARGTVIATAILLTTVLAEFFIGTYDPNDIAAACAGYVAAMLTCIAHGSNPLSVLNQQPQPGQRLPSRADHIILATGLLACSCVFIGGSFYGYDCHDCGGVPFASAEPVYMSYQELRSAVVAGPARELNDVQRVYLFEDMIFLNRKNQGIHVLDNTYPQNPVNLAFINIPGNTELSIRNNSLYADSFIDLVTLDLSDKNNIHEVNRVQEVFPYDEYQAVPDGVYFGYDLIDRNKGVVVSYVPAN